MTAAYSWGSFTLISVPDGRWRAVSLIAGAGFEELGEGVAGQRLAAAKLARHQADAREVLHRLHAHEGVEQGGTVRNNAMVGHQDSIVSLNIGSQAVGQLRRAGGGIGRQRERSPGSSRSQSREVRPAPSPDDANAVAVGGWAWTTAETSFRLLIYSQMHADLTGDRHACRRAASHSRVTMTMSCATQQGLAATGGRSQNAFRIEPHRQVAGGSRNKAQPRQPAGVLGQLPAKIALCLAHRHTCVHRLVPRSARLRLAKAGETVKTYPLRFIACAAGYGFNLSSSFSEALAYFPFRIATPEVDHTLRWQHCNASQRDG